MLFRTCYATITTVVCVFAWALPAQSQTLLERAKQKIKDKANQRVERTMDRGLDKADEQIDSALVKKKQKQAAPAQAEQPAHEGGNTAANGQNAAGNAVGTEAFGIQSKFDFVAGEKLMAYENFERVAVGDFPADWNTNSSGEVVTATGTEGKWLMMPKNGKFIPDFMPPLPENATLQMDFMIDTDPTNNYYGMGIYFTRKKDLSTAGTQQPTAAMYLHPGGNSVWFATYDSTGEVIVENSVPMPQWNVSDRKQAKISIWRQKGRMRLYVGTDKVLDLPRFFGNAAPVFVGFDRNFFGDCNVFVKNLSLATGAPDTRHKLMNEGKWVTRGITFASGSDVALPFSAGTLKELATVLTENASLRIRIIGHTDNDGGAAANIDLSKRRAAHIKMLLSTQYGIDASRMETDGKGDTLPSEPNTSAQGKAANRRVEIVKI